MMPRKGESLFGISTEKFNGAYGFPTGSPVPQGGLYGAGAFGYSIKPQVAPTSGSQL